MNDFFTMGSDPIVFLTMGSDPIVFITAIEDNGAEKTIAYKYRWSPYQQRKFQEAERIA